LDRTLHDPSGNAQLKVLESHEDIGADVNEAPPQTVESRVWGGSSLIDPRPRTRPRLSRGCTANSTRLYTSSPCKHG